MDQQAQALAEAAGMTVEQARVFLDAQAAMQAGAAVGVVMREARTGLTAVRVQTPGGLPEWSLIAPDSPWSKAWKPVDLAAGDWQEWGPKSPVATSSGAAK